MSATPSWRYFHPSQKMESAALFSAALRRHLASTIAATATDADTSASSNPIIPSGRNTILGPSRKFGAKNPYEMLVYGYGGKHDEEGKH
ncbi:hypothetical protein FH972_010365 [Carpinus fangiana]|uniref:Uncharacterized protein n=1 Tax=Carpinus fangiana TaxID=176857 RepID=A0A660KU60_9ROSI|nr:hypothetical protein FH972_010365 [Carpinus fangiana]